MNCSATESCERAQINGQAVDQLNIHCTVDNSCKDITLYCPPFTGSIADDLEIEKHCIVYGNGQISETEHSNLTIYADNSWNDIEFIDYWPMVQSSGSKMHCDHDSCLINNPYDDGEWNCLDEKSGCFVGKVSNLSITRCYSDSIEINQCKKRKN